MINTDYLLDDSMVCPYCNYVDEDSWENEPNSSDEWFQVECGRCSKTFLFERVVDVRYSTEKADCANNLADHKWKNRVSAPREYSVGKQQCQVCYSDRTIDDEEWERIDADHAHPQNWRTS